nr:HlyD family efflux transporter periplasmic adaptor subunit [Patescibacteria group bacterium]
ALEKISQPTDATTILQAENSLTASREAVEKLKRTQESEYQNALTTKQNAEDAVVKGTEDAFNAISNTFLDATDVITHLDDTLHGTGIDEAESSVTGGQSNSTNLFNSVASEHQSALRVYQYAAEADYESARTAYDTTLLTYKNTTRYSDQATIELLLTDTLSMTKAMAQAAKSESTYLGSWVDFRTQHGWSTFAEVTKEQAALTTDIGQTNTHLSALLSAEQSLESNRQTIAKTDRDIATMLKNQPADLAAAEATIKEKEASLENLKSGAEPLDIQSQQLTLRQRANALTDAREKPADYSVRAPFDGVIATVAVKKGDTLSSGGAVVTLISAQQLAQISLNEVDVAKVAIGQKATLTFDAVEGLTLSGQVAEIDALGTVTQGVVSYGIKIVFDTQDERIKPGMSVSAAIITNAKQDVLLVASAAIKTQGNIHTVEVFDDVPTVQGTQGMLSATPPRQQVVEVGLSDDTTTEILSGLTEGQQVVTRTILSTTAKAAATQAPSLFGAVGGNRATGAAGGATRALR